MSAGLSGKQELRNAKRPQRRTQTTGHLMEFASNEEYFAALRALIERWCDQRKLGALSRLLPGYLSLNGLTDGWANLYESLKSTRGLGYEAFSAADWDLLNELIRGAEKAVYRR
jgi:hypothetical protein